MSLRYFKMCKILIAIFISGIHRKRQTWAAPSTACISRRLRNLKLIEPGRPSQRRFAQRTDLIQFVRSEINSRRSRTSRLGRDIILKQQIITRDFVVTLSSTFSPSSLILVTSLKPRKRISILKLAPRISRITFRHGQVSTNERFRTWRHSGVTEQPISAPPSARSSSFLAQQFAPPRNAKSVPTVSHRSIGRCRCCRQTSITELRSDEVALSALAPSWRQQLEEVESHGRSSGRGDFGAEEVSASLLHEDA